MSGHKKDTPFYYVWTPGAPPMKEGQVVVRKVDGEEQIHVCDWIHFRVRLVKGKDEIDYRFENEN